MLTTADTTGARWADHPEARLLLIISSERSGSTLLRFMLGGHSRVVWPAELFLMRYRDYDEWRAQKPVAMESVLEYFRLLGVAKSAAEVEAACRGRSAVEVFEWMFGFLPPGRILVDKTPAYASELAILERSRPLQPFYVWLIRHPLGVIDSQVRLKEKLRLRKAARGGLGKRLRAQLGTLARRWSGTHERVARRREAKWVAQNRNLATFLRQVPADRQVTVYFEEMVRAPPAALAQVCAAIGLMVEPAMAELRGAPPPEMNPHLGDPNFHQHRRVDAETADDWAARYEESWLRPETRQLMDEIGVRRVAQSSAGQNGRPPASA
jgi:hypothetical protein